MTQLPANERMVRGRPLPKLPQLDTALHGHLVCLDECPQGCEKRRMARVRRGSRGGSRRSGAESPEQPRHLIPKAPTAAAEYAHTHAQPASPEQFHHSLPPGFGTSYGRGYQQLPLPPPPLTTSRQQHAYAGPQSPDSTISTGSFGNSSLGFHSFDTGSLSALEHRRNLSPHEHTPTHSVASLDRSASQDGFSAFLTAQERTGAFGSSISERIFQQGGTLEPLAGINAIHEDEGNDWASPRSHNIHTPPITPLLPQGLQHLNDLEEPWSPLEIEDAGSPNTLHLTRSSSVNTRTEELSLSPRSPTKSIAKPGRRQGPLSSDARHNANEVRRERSCLRCFVYKETCDTNHDNCSNCMNKQARTWRLGCVRPRLMFRTGYLLPDILANRLNRKYVDSFIQHRGWPCRDRPRFAIPLEIGLDTVLILPVREFLPIGDMSRPAYLPVSTGGGENKAIPINMYDLPVIISCEREEQAANYIRRELSLWCNKAIASTQKSDWAWKWFNKGTDPFPGSIMKCICEYFDPSLAQHKLLKEALGLSFFNYIFIYSFDVPKEDVKILLSKMENPPPVNEDYISPSIINLYVKMLMLPPLRDVVKRTLRGLEVLLLDQQNPRTWRRDLIFCVSFIILAYLGRTQVSILQFAHQPVRDNGKILTREDAEKQVQEMESEFADLVIKYHQQFLTPSPRRKTASAVATQSEQECEEHALGFRLMEKVQQACSENLYTMPRSLDLDYGDIGDFIANNTTRLCWKFVMSIMPFSEPKADADTEMAM